jgi:hypothetical protein
MSTVCSSAYVVPVIKLLPYALTAYPSNCFYLVALATSLFRCTFCSYTDTEVMSSARDRVSGNTKKLIPLFLSAYSAIVTEIHRNMEIHHLAEKRRQHVLQTYANFSMTKYTLLIIVPFLRRRKHLSPFYVSGRTLRPYSR